MVNQQLIINESQLKALINFELKKLKAAGDMLDWETLEKITCQGTGLTHVGGSDNFADGYKHDIQASIKTRKIYPKIYSNKMKKYNGKSTDFQQSPNIFLGPEILTEKKSATKIYTAGIEIVMRRTAIDLDEKSSSPSNIGKATIESRDIHMKDSYKIYKTSKSYEIFVVHGYDLHMKSYLVSLFWKEQKKPNITNIIWEKHKNSIIGYYINNNLKYKKYERVNSGASRESTCYKSYEDLTSYPDNNTLHLSIPIPERFIFDENENIKEIENNEKKLNISLNTVLFDCN